MADPVVTDTIYRDSMDPNYREQVERDWATQPHPDTSMTQKMADLASAMSVTNGAKGAATLGMALPINRFTNALRELAMQQRNRYIAPADALKALEADPAPMARFLEPYKSNAIVQPLGAGSEVAAVRVGDRVIKMEPWTNEGIKDIKMQQYPAVAKLPQMLGPTRMEYMPNLTNEGLFVTEQPLATPFSKFVPHDSPQGRPAYEMIRDYFNKLWDPHGYGMIDPHTGNVGIPRPPDMPKIPHVIDLGAPYAIPGHSKSRPPRRIQDIPVANTDDIIQWRK